MLIGYMRVSKADGSQATDLQRDALIAADVPQDKVIGISQGWKMAGAIKTTERRLAEGGLHHAGSKLMAWCVGNAKAIQRGNSVAIDKAISGKAKIDPLVAEAFRASDRAALAAGGPQVNEEWVTFASDGHRELLETTKTPLLDAAGQIIARFEKAGLKVAKTKVAKRMSDVELAAALADLDSLLA